MARAGAWRRLNVLVDALASTPGTRTHVALGGSEWTLTDRLLAAAVDVLAMANWQRQGKRGAPRPKPISPRDRPSEAEQSGDAAGRNQDEIDRLLDAMRTGAFERG